MNLSNPIYHDADKAREHLEALLWADGPVCPHCKARDHACKIKGGRKGLHVLQCLPHAILGDGRNRVRALQNPAEQMGSGYAPHVGFKDRRFRPSASPHAGHYLQVGLVHVPSHS